MIEDPTRTKDLIKAIEESNDTFSMQSFDQHLMRLVKDQTIAYDEALKLSTHPENFALKYSGVSSGGATWDGASAAGEPVQPSEWGPGGGVRVFELDDDEGGESA
jgi:twitching motility protein PilT